MENKAPYVPEKYLRSDVIESAGVNENFTQHDNYYHRVPDLIPSDTVYYESHKMMFPKSSEAYNTSISYTDKYLLNLGKKIRHNASKGLFEVVIKSGIKQKYKLLLESLGYVVWTEHAYINGVFHEDHHTKISWCEG